MLFYFILLGVIAVNIVAYLQARAMSHFVVPGERTLPPEKLSRWQKAWVVLTGVRLPRPNNPKTPAEDGLAFETRKFSGAFGISLEAWLIRQPESKGLMVMFHGYGGSKAGLLPTSRAFRELGYDTMLVDFYGSGGSGGNTTSIGFHEAVDVRSAWTEARSFAGGRPIFLFGASMGAAAIIKAIHDGGVEPSGIILECPFDNMLNTVKHRFQAMGLPSFPGAPLLVFWGGVQEGFNGFRHNPAEYARDVHCPALLLNGDHDPRVAVNDARTIAQNFAGPKQIVILQDVRHENYVLAHPEAWKRAVAEFLKTVK